MIFILPAVLVLKNECLFGRPHGRPTLTLYWAKRTGAFSLLPYWGHRHTPDSALPADDRPPTPTAIDIFGGEIVPFPKPPRELAERYFNVVAWAEHGKGGHFPAVPSRNCWQEGSGTCSSLTAISPALPGGLCRTCPTMTVRPTRTGHNGLIWLLMPLHVQSAAAAPSRQARGPGLSTGRLCLPPVSTRLEARAPARCEPRGGAPPSQPTVGGDLASAAPKPWSGLPGGRRLATYRAPRLVPHVAQPRGLSRAAPGGPAPHRHPWTRRAEPTHRAQPSANARSWPARSAPESGSAPPGRPVRPGLLANAATATGRPIVLPAGPGGRSCPFRTHTAAHRAAVAVLGCCTRRSICSNYASGQWS